MEHFLATVCTHEWNRGQDAGRTFAEGARLLKAEHPDKAELIDAYRARFDKMMPGPIAGSVEILAELKALGASLYCLTNFSAETYPPTFERFEFLQWFRGVVVSGEVGVIKPDPRIFELLIERFAIDPKRAVYIDERRRERGGCPPVRHSRDPFHDAYYLTCRAHRTRAPSLADYAFAMSHRGIAGSS